MKEIECLRREFWKKWKNSDGWKIMVTLEDNREETKKRESIWNGRERLKRYILRKKNFLSTGSTRNSISSSKNEVRVEKKGERKMGRGRKRKTLSEKEEFHEIGQENAFSSVDFFLTLLFQSQSNDRWNCKEKETDLIEGDIESISSSFKSLSLSLSFSPLSFSVTETFVFKSSTPPLLVHWYLNSIDNSKRVVEESVWERKWNEMKGNQSIEWMKCQTLTEDNEV